MAEKFSDADLNQIATEQKCSVAELKTRWIIQQGRAFYIVGSDGKYARPISKGELAQSLRRDLLRVPVRVAPSGSPSSVAGIEWYHKRDDVQIEKSVDEILSEHCTVARSAVADMSLKCSFYDAVDQVMYEAVCPLNDVTPVFHPAIAEWLRLFGGPQHDKLLDWIATMTRIDRPSCALLITGKSGAGKEMLAQGLARRWRKVRAPTELGRVLEGFNEDLARCPLVFCDESMPYTRGGKKGALADLKSMIAASSRTLARKFLSNADLIGAVRLILAANNNRMLENSDDATIDDQESTAGRFMHVKVNTQPGEYLRAIGGRNATESWVAGGQLAEHAAWLEKNRVVEFGSRRFIVDGDATDLQRQLMVNNKSTSLILEWLVRFLLAESPSSIQAIIGNGELLVNSTTISSQWNAYVKSDFAPSTTAIGNGLRTLSVVERRHYWGDITSGARGREVRYQSVKPDFIYEWAEQNQVGVPAELKERIEAVIDIKKLLKEGTLPTTTKAPKIPAPPVTEGHSLFDSIQ